MGSWIGCDLDGTLAHYDGWKGELDIGAPIPSMVERIKGHLAQNHEVRIFTARVGPQGASESEVEQIRQAIREWTQEHLVTILSFCEPWGKCEHRLRLTVRAV